MRQRISDGIRLMGTREFLHSRIVASAIEASSLSLEIVARVRLEGDYRQYDGPAAALVGLPITYDEEYATRFSSALRAKMSCESDRPFPG